MKPNIQPSSLFKKVSESAFDFSSDSENSQGHRNENILEENKEKVYEDIE